MRRTREGYAASPRKGDATSVARRSRERLSSVRRQSRQRLRNRPVEKKKCFGGSVRIHADLLPPAGEGWRSRVAVRDGNAVPLGATRPGEVQRSILRRFSLPLNFPCGAAAAGHQSLRPPGRHLAITVGGAPPSSGLQIFLGCHRMKKREDPFRVLPHFASVTSPAWRCTGPGTSRF